MSSFSLRPVHFEKLTMKRTLSLVVIVHKLQHKLFFFPVTTKTAAGARHFASTLVLELLCSAESNSDGSFFPEMNSDMKPQPSGFLAGGEGGPISRDKCFILQASGGAAVTTLHQN